MIKTIIMTKRNEICNKAISFLKDKNNFYDRIKIVDIIRGDGFIGTTQEQLIEKINCGLEVDLIISFLYPNKIKEPLISYPKLGCINFHPAPLPEYRGFSPYTKGIMDGVSRWGVTAHYIDDNIDTGDIIQVNDFDIDHDITSSELSKTARDYLFKLFVNIMFDIRDDKALNRTKQSGGKYFSKIDFEKHRLITEDDSYDLIDKKSRAYWCPPFDGAYVRINGNELTVIPKSVLNELGKG